MHFQKLQHIHEIPGYFYYFAIFCLVSLSLILSGYAAIVTNDDWMLFNLLRDTDTYGTLVMSYPLSYVLTQLYRISPSFPWYSLLLSALLLFYTYLMSHYIYWAQNKLQKVLLFIASMLLIVFFWLHMTITALSILTMTISLGFAKKHFRYALVFLFVAFMLRADLVAMFVPFWIIGVLILRNPLHFLRQDYYAILIFFVLIGASFFVEKLDQDYTTWKSFNQARAVTSDMHILDPSNVLTKEQKFLMISEWLQDDILLPTQKVIKANANPKVEILTRLSSFDYINFFHYRLAAWFYLLIGVSLFLMFFYRKNWRIVLIPIFITGIMLLIVMRDVDRVTIPLFLMWAFIIIESLKKHRLVNTLFLSLFVLIFLYYSSASMQYRYFKENTALKREAQALIDKTGVVCEISMGFPTQFSAELISLMQVNYLFHENDWLHMNQNEILPNSWISRHPFFYKTHQINFNGIKRKFDNYYKFLLDDHTGFLGSRYLQESQGAAYLLYLYDKEYLKDRPTCKHVIALVAVSENFSISQIRIDCKGYR